MEAAWAVVASVGVMMGLSSHRAVVGAVVVEVEVLGRSTVPEGVVTTTTLGGVMATCGGSEVVTPPVLPTEVGTPDPEVVGVGGATLCSCSC